MSRILVTIALGLTACASAKPTPETATTSSPRATPTATATAVSTGDAHPKFTIHVADVGTGLAVLVEGEDFALVYDAGSNDDTGIGAQNRFMAYLKWAVPNLKKIDHVILSHPHRDHVELLADVITGYDVANVWDSGAINPICGYRRFVQAVADKPSIAYHTGASDEGAHTIRFGAALCSLPPTVSVTHAARILEGAPIQLGKRAQLTILHVDGVTHLGDDFNLNSIVAVLDLDGTKVLMMGDGDGGARAEPTVPPTATSLEGYLLAKYKTVIDGDVLIAGNHGSKSASRKAFLDAVTPRVSIISSGPTKYGSVLLPDAVVRDTLANISKVYETDKNDATCGANAHKVGAPSDGKPGGCDNIQIKIHGADVDAVYASP
jgi:competence protein ComEC